MHCIQGTFYIATTRDWCGESRSCGKEGKPHVPGCVGGKEVKVETPQPRHTFAEGLMIQTSSTETAVLLQHGHHCCHQAKKMCRLYNPIEYQHLIIGIAEAALDKWESVSF